MNITTFAKKAWLIAIGLMTLALGIAIVQSLVWQSMNVFDWNQASTQDIISLAFSILTGLVLTGMGALMTINPKIKGYKAW